MSCPSCGNQSLVFQNNVFGSCHYLCTSCGVTVCYQD